MQSSEYVCNLLKSTDALFLSETWLKPHQSNVISEVLSFNGVDTDNCSIFCKSGMINAPADYVGRPYGGVAWICNHNDLLNYREIECASNRVIPLQVMHGNHHVQTVIGVYMPFYKSGDQQQTEESVATLDAIQEVIDKYAPMGPLQLCGDLNVQLPRGYKLSKSWHTLKGYSAHSLIMYDFISANDLICADFRYPQTVNYTYFQHETKAYTWIDHVLVSASMSDNQNVNCFIHEYNEHNMSDHLPISFIIEFKMTNLGSDVVNRTNVFRSPNWENYNIREKYCERVASEINELPALDISSVHPNSTDATDMINNRISAINSCLIEAAADLCHSPSNKQYKPKCFWGPELASLRDKKKFWWNIWVANGRPREGHIFEIWKSTKKAYRKFYRRRCGTSVNLRFNKINALFSRGRSIWNLIKTKTKPPRLNVDIQDLANHFNSIMTDVGCLDGNQINIRNEVSNFYRSFQDNILDCDILGSTIRENIGKLKRKCALGIDGVTTEHMLFALSDTLCTELASVYSHMFKYNAVPDVLQIGIIVPILKKSTLPSNDYNNFRPITLSTVHAKLVELIILPTVNLDIGGNQYGYQTGKGTEFCCALLNDSVAYFNEGDSAVYMCTLDAVKCFDNIWHEGLFYKLMSRMSIIYWRLLFNWYKSMRATIRLNNEFSQFLNITKGTRQGSVLSPHLFNVFIDERLDERLRRLPLWSTYWLS